MAATIDNFMVTRFCNGSLRPLANALVSAYDAAKQIVEDYDAAGIEAAMTLEGGLADFQVFLSDGSLEDGRPQITPGGVALTFANLKTLIAQLEAVDQNTGLSMIAGCRAIAPRYTTN